MKVKIDIPNQLLVKGNLDISRFDGVVKQKYMRKVNFHLNIHHRELRNICPWWSTSCLENWKRVNSLFSTKPLPPWTLAERWSIGSKNIFPYTLENIPTKIVLCSVSFVQGWKFCDSNAIRSSVEERIRFKKTDKLFKKYMRALVLAHLSSFKLKYSTSNISSFKNVILTPFLD